MGIVSFPSYHATLPVILAWSVRDIRVLRVVAPIWAAVTIVATPVFGGHYGVDVIAGLGLAATAIPIASRLARLRLSPPVAISTFRFALQPVLRRGGAERARAMHARRLAGKGIG